ncbi:MAG: Trimethylamine:corrinoid methyltransferase, MttB2 [Candidatus Methanohalarchaeum thermophilum]|uniref:Trimethylamine:corrinoid methyltransferase, MttB2 n=1 Tax=Methanohalarchaeum thermophilum TaxID=1903181 RepID=A0A1Q6DT46_METT1|nr:MAG: Trimethylamine:corrinoid methyltransferase, MttB2 [Candidatus Methanohalarchaeum thermophilum]
MKDRTWAGINSQKGSKLELFTDDELDKIHRSTMKVLRDPGIRVETERARNVFREAGCEVDGKIVKIPEHLVNDALSKAPSSFNLPARDEDKDVMQEAGPDVNCTTFGTGVSTLEIDDNGNFNIRDSKQKDIEDQAKLADYLDSIDYYSLTVAARDLPSDAEIDVHEFLTSIKNTSKHFHHIDPVAENVEYYWEMVKAYYGGDEEMARERPIFSMLLCPTSPLQLGENGLKVIEKGAKLGIPVNVLSMAMAGASGNMNLASTLVTHNAEVLAGIVLSQIFKPGAPVWYGSSTTMFDVKKGTAPVGAPELGMISASVAKLGQYYDLPTFVAGI